jgi:predicted nucleic acid-binding Zn ribbon protein
MKGLLSLLPDFLQQAASNDEVALIFLRELWPSIVGQDLAAKTKPAFLRNRCLTLEAPNSVWCTELRELAPLFVDSINRYWNLQLVEKIRVRVHLGKVTTDSSDLSED